MTSRVLMQTLAKHGLERIDPAENGEKFDPNKHEALFQTKVEGKEDGTVFATQQTGFLLNGRVVRVSDMFLFWRVSLGVFAGIGLMVFWVGCESGGGEEFVMRMGVVGGSGG